VGSEKETKSVDQLDDNSNVASSDESIINCRIYEYGNGDQAVTLPNGIELISQKNGTKIGRLPDGSRYVINPDGSGQRICAQGVVTSI